MGGEEEPKRADGPSPIEVSASVSVAPETQRSQGGLGGADNSGWAGARRSSGGGPANGRGGGASRQGPGLEQAEASQVPHLESRDGSVSSPRPYDSDQGTAFGGKRGWWTDKRRALRKVAQHDMFTFFIYVCITLNTITIGISDVEIDRQPDGATARFIEGSDWVILVVFTVEMVIKILAYGPGYRLKEVEGETEDEAIIREYDADEESGGYFSIGWNRFDAIVVVLSWALVAVQALTVESKGITRIVRAFRIARPLRALRSFEGTQDVLLTFPAAVPAMRDILTLLLFVFFIYAILGINLFGLDGEFHGRCVVDTDEHGTKGLLMLGHLSYIEPLCGEGWNCGDGFRCSCKPLRYENGTEEDWPYAFQDPMTGDPGCITMGWAERQESNEPICPNFGFECFDNFALAVLSCFWSITLDSWSFRLWWAEDTNGVLVASLYFVSLVVIVSFNVINLNVAVISFAYKEVRDRRREISKLREKVRRLRGHQHLPEPVKPEGALEVMKKRLGAVTAAFFRKTPYEKLPMLNRATMIARTIASYPNPIDERGILVPLEIVRMAETKNILVRYGPQKGRWCMTSSKDGAIRIMVPASPISQAVQTAVSGNAPEAGAGMPAGSFGEEVIAEGQVLAEGVSEDERKEALKTALGEYRDQVRGDDGGGQGAQHAGMRRPAAYMDVIVLLFIVTNTLCMCCEHYTGTAIETEAGFVPDDHCCDSKCELTSHEECPRGIQVMPEVWIQFLFWSEGLFNIIFTMETVIRLVAAWSIRDYVCENFPTNLIDMIIVVTSDVVFVVELFLPSLLNVAIFRLIRVMRAFRVISRFRRLKVLLNKAVASLKTIMQVLFVLIFWHIVFGMLGMQIFRCDVQRDDLCKPLPDGSCPEGCSLKMGETCYFSDDEMWDNCPWSEEHNFNRFSMSMIELVFVLTGENWVDTMQAGMRSTNSVWPGLIFFIFFYIVAFYMLFNLFIGVILEEFELTDEEKEALQMGLFRLQVLKQIKRSFFEKMSGSGSLAHGHLRKTGTDRKDSMLSKVSAKSDHSSFGKHAASPEIPSSLMDDQMEGDVEDYGTSRTSQDEDTASGSWDGSVANLTDHQQAESTLCFCLPPATPNAAYPDAPMNLRGVAEYITSTVWFERIILLAIVVSAVILALESPVNAYRMASLELIQVCDYVFLTIFATEFVLKILVHGFFWESEAAYFRSWWNLLDFTILASQVLDVSGLSFLKGLRVMRVVRPLRLLNKIESLQLLLISVHSSAGDMFNVLLLWMFAFVVFGILGVNLYAGKLYKCNDDDFVGPPLNPSEVEGSNIGYRDGCVGNFFTFQNEGGDSYVSDSVPTGLFKPRVWSNPSDSSSGRGYSFDNVALAMQTLYEVSTFEEWSDPVFSIIHATQVGQQPIMMSQRAHVMYLLAWVVLSCFFVLQLVIGVLIDAINQKSGTALCTELQRNWITMLDRIKKLTPLSANSEPAHPWRRTAFRVANSIQFQGFITFVIVTNILLMATESYKQAKWWYDAMSNLNLVFIVIYMGEILIKIFAYLHKFFTDLWNIFDVVVVLASIVEISIGPGGAVGLQALRAIRMLKVFRALRLVRRARRLRTMINALIGSLPPIISSMVFMCLLIFFFATLGVQFFSGVRFGPGLNRRNNFNTAPEALMLLTRVSTGENWETVMRDCAIEYPYCTTTEEAQRVLGDPTAIGDCGSTVGSYIFFDLFFLLGTHILVNLFVAVLLENFFNFQMQDSFVLSEDHLVSYQKRWAELDTNDKGVMSVMKFRELIERLYRDRNPLGMTVLASELKFRAVRMEVIANKPKGGELVFADLAITLGLHVVGSHGLPYGDMLKRQQELAQYARLAAVSKLTHVYRSLSQEYAVTEGQGDSQKSTLSVVNEGNEAESTVHLNPAEVEFRGAYDEDGTMRQARLLLEMQQLEEELVAAAGGDKSLVRSLAWQSASITTPPFSHISTKIASGGSLHRPPSSN